MAIIDIVLLLCFIPGIISGISKGFVSQAIDVVSLVLGAWAAFRFAEPVSLWLGSFLSLSEAALKIIAFVLIICAVSLVFTLVGKIITRLLKAICLGWVNTLLGIVFGIVKTALILGFLIMIFESIVGNLEFISADTLAKLDGAVVYNAIADLSKDVFPVIKTFVTGLDA